MGLVKFISSNVSAQCMGRRSDGVVFDVPESSTLGKHDEESGNLDPLVWS